jgi:hypothetical protein
MIFTGNTVYHRKKLLSGQRVDREQFPVSTKKKLYHKPHEHHEQRRGASGPSGTERENSGNNED